MILRGEGRENVGLHGSRSVAVSVGGLRQSC